MYIYLVFNNMNLLCITKDYYYARRVLKKDKDVNFYLKIISGKLVNFNCSI